MYSSNSTTNPGALSNPGKNDSSAEFQIRPPNEKKFSKDLIKETLHTLLSEELKDRTYDEEEMEKLIVSLASKIKSNIKNIVGSDYKLVIQVTLGEQRGAGVRAIARCLWDSATDELVNMTYANDSLFCVASVFTIYYY